MFYIQWEVNMKVKNYIQLEEALSSDEKIIKGKIMVHGKKSRAVLVEKNGKTDLSELKEYI